MLRLEGVYLSQVVSEGILCVLAAQLKLDTHNNKIMMGLIFFIFVIVIFPNGFETDFSGNI
jgi:ABC-type transport system involved in cytochrome c biogenesis permease component